MRINTFIYTPEDFKIDSLYYIMEIYNINKEDYIER